MSATHMQQEKQAQFERDQDAFKKLSDASQFYAEVFAMVGFGSRSAVVGLFRATLFAFEFIYTYGMKKPYEWCAENILNPIWQAVKPAFQAVGAALLGAGKLALKGLETASKWGVHQVATVWQFGAELLNLRKGGGIEELRKKIKEWEKDAIAAVDRFWRKTEEVIKKIPDFVEYQGIAGLYRLTKYILNPRLPSGKPLFINEGLNKGIGLLTAAALVVFGGMKLAETIVAIKVYQFAQSAAILQSGASVLSQIGQMLVLHPAMFVAVKVLEFSALPVIAAARQTLKVSPFSQGVAYQYNLRLRESDKAIGPRKPSRFNSVEKGIAHVFERGAPEFYEAQIRHYQGLLKGGEKAAVAPVALDATPSALDGITASGEFNKKVQPPAASVDNPVSSAAPDKPKR